MESHEIMDLSTVKEQALAGALSGVVESSVMYPIDLMKTRMQILKPYSKANYQSVFGGLLKIGGEEGARRLFRGMPLPLIASVPAHALYFSSYEKTKRLVSGTEFATKSVCGQGVAALVAITNHNVIMNPADVIKQRMQVYNSPYRSSLHCLVKVVRSEGFSALYRSLPTQMCIDAPHSMLHFIIYEKSQELLNPTRKFNAASHVICGGLAGACASAATNPLDVCRTLLNTQEKASLGEVQRTKIKGLYQAFNVIYSMHGLWGFTRGMKARVMHSVPSTAICWCTYEFFKHYFTDRNIEDKGSMP